MPRILRIINRLNLGGIAHNVAYLTKYLEPEYETLLLAGSKDDSEESSAHILNQVGVEAQMLSEMRRAINPLNDWKAFKEIKNIITEYKPDIVHTHAAKAGMLGRLAAIQMKVPVIVHTFHGHVFHSYFPPLKTRFFIELEKWLAKRTTAIVAISELQKKELADIYKIAGHTKIHTIPLGFDLLKFQEGKELKRSNFRIKYHLDDTEIAIGIIGRLVPIKNHQMFFNAIQLLKSLTSKSFRVFVIGDGELSSFLKEKATEMQLDWVDYNVEKRKATITFTSWITEIDQAYAGLDIVALSSLNEGTPVSLIEAQAAGNPSVSTAVGGVSDTVLENKTTLLVNSGDFEGFAHALLRLIESEELRIVFGDAGWLYVKEKYHFTRLVADMRSLYDKLLYE